MTKVNIYNNNGEVVGDFIIKEDIQYLQGRVSVGKQYYYKGAGIKYISHYSYCPSSFVNIIKELNGLYLRYLVVNPNFIGKFGVFVERYFPIYSEFIGACGIREKNLIKHSEEFGLSDIQVFDYINYNSDTSQGYYVVRYRSKRRTFLEGGDCGRLGSLLEFMIEEGWNFPWDKPSINDISYVGWVTDVADLFRSKLLIHQIGTVFSVLSSLRQADAAKYKEFIRSQGVEKDCELLPDVFFILKKYGADINNIKDSIHMKYYLALGRNCYYGEYKEMGDKRKQLYLLDFKKNYASLDFNESF